MSASCIRLPEPINKGAGAVRVPRRYQSRSGLHPITRSPRLFCRTRCGYQRTGSPRNSRPVLEGRNQSIVVALDVEDDPGGFQNARLWIAQALTSSGLRHSARTTMSCQASY